MAKVKSTNPNGKREFTIIDKEKISTMALAYADDGELLSNRSKTKIGRQLLIFLTELTDVRIN